MESKKVVAVKEIQKLGTSSERKAMREFLLLNRKLGKEQHTNIIRFVCGNQIRFFLAFRVYWHWHWHWHSRLPFSAKQNKTKPFRNCVCKKNKNVSCLLLSTAPANLFPPTRPILTTNCKTNSPSTATQLLKQPLAKQNPRCQVDLQHFLCGDGLLQLFRGQATGRIPAVPARGQQAPVTVQCQCQLQWHWHWHR